jgi:hypothetical protein
MEKNSVVIDFQKYKNRIDLKDKICCFNKITKFGVFYIGKNQIIIIFHKTTTNEVL